MGNTDSATPGIHPELEAHGSFEHLKLGRSEVRHDPLTLRFAKYLDDAVVLPQIPDVWDWTTGVPVWPMYGNDSKGDCTIACAGHMEQAWTAAAGAPVTPDDVLLEQAYIPGTGNDDTGRVEVEVLNYWRKTGIAGHQIVAYAYLDPKNLDHVRAAIYLFGGVYVGISLPKSAQGQAVWDVVGDGLTGDSQPGSWGGHAVPYLAFGAGLKTVTWGAVLSLTEAFHLAYCDEAYVPISLDFLKDGKTPAGFDVAALTADLEAIGKVEPTLTGDAQVGQTLTGNGGAWSGASPTDDPNAPVDPNANIENVDADVLRKQIDAAPDGGSSDYYWKG